jgi:hypothetical protein
MCVNIIRQPISTTTVTPLYTDLNSKESVRIEYLPPIGRCDCGSSVVIRSSYINKCRCGAHYNGLGNRVWDREDWLEDYSEDYEY